MRSRVGCFGLMAVAGLAGLFPNLCYLAHGARKPVARAPHRAPICLEAWVRLRSYRDCPVLAEGAGYRLGIYCFPGGCSGPAGSSNGALVLAGPFPGRAYVSERPVPLGDWVHVAGCEDLAPAAKAAVEAQSLVPCVAIGGTDVTAGRMAGWTGPLALGYDPWEARSRAAKAAEAALASLATGTHGHRRGRDCGGMPGPPDGEIGAWRWSRGWRSLSQIAAGRGTPQALMPLERPSALPGPAPPGPAGGITSRGWVILVVGLLAALAMAGAGMALRRGSDGPRWSERSEAARRSCRDISGRVAGAAEK